MEAHIDFEERSPIPIECGLDNHLRHAEILCMGWAIGDNEPDIWVPGEPFPAALRTHIAAGGTCVAHNAEFEHLLFKTLLPAYAPRLGQWWCTATQAAACGYPRALAAACKAARVEHQKDGRGKYLIDMLCVPPFVVDENLLQELYEYCRQDVRAERALAKVLRKPTEEERRDWEANVIINGRGLPLDVPMTVAAAKTAAYNHAEAECQVSFLTGGELTKIAGPKLLRWVNGKLGTELTALDQYERATLLGGDLPTQVREVLELIDDTSYSAVSKHAAAGKRVSPDDRLRGSYVLNGAAQTGRFSSTGLQVHNLPRLDYKEIMRYTGHDEGAEDAALDALCSMITQGHVVPQLLLAQATRPMIKASSGRWLVWGDWSAIEGRALPWLAGSAGSTEKLWLYRQGQDIYRHTAAAIFGITPEAVSAAQRQEGKVAELALGFGGGPGALLNMARAYRVSMTEAAAKVTVRRWREANGWAVDYWDRVYRAFVTALRHPHEAQWAGRVRYCYLPETSAVWCELPSGRLLAYRDPHYTVKPEHRRRKGDLPNERELTVRRGHARVPVWHGLLVENITQATAADLLRQALRDSLLSLYVVGHTHDEIITECDTADVPYVRKLLEETMATVPGWAEGLPLAVKVEDGERYGK